MRQRLALIDPKKFPERPELIWNERAGDHSADQLKMLALAWASNGPEVRRQMMQQKKQQT